MWLIQFGHCGGQAITITEDIKGSAEVSVRQSALFFFPHIVSRVIDQEKLTITGFKSEEEFF